VAGECIREKKERPHKKRKKKKILVEKKKKAEIQGDRDGSYINKRKKGNLEKRIHLIIGGEGFPGNKKSAFPRKVEGYGKEKRKGGLKKKEASH